MIDKSLYGLMAGSGGPQMKPPQPQPQFSMNPGQYNPMQPGLWGGQQMQNAMGGRPGFGDGPGMGAGNPWPNWPAAQQHPMLQQMMQQWLMNNQGQNPHGRWGQ